MPKSSAPSSSGSINSVIPQVDTSQPLISGYVKVTSVVGEVNLLLVSWPENSFGDDNDDALGGLLAVEVDDENAVTRRPGSANAANRTESLSTRRSSPGIRE